MGFKSILAGLDYLHPTQKRSTKHGLQANVFGVEVPAWIVFHTVLGYVLLAVGLITILLRIPVKPVKRIRWLHPHVGYAWIFGTIWMPVTAIWCLYSFTGWDFVAFFIFSMYAAIQLGWLCVRCFGRLRSKQIGLLDNTETSKMGWRSKIWKWLHGFFMLYSFCMLLGAGISFPFRAINKYAN